MDSNPEVDGIVTQPKTGLGLMSKQLSGLLYKRFKHTLRDWKFGVSAFVLPVLLLTIVLGVTKMGLERDNPPLLLTPSLHGPEANSFIR